MKNIEENSSKKPLLIGFAVLIILVLLGLLFWFKNPLDFLNYKTSKISKLKYRVYAEGKGKKIKNEELALVDLAYGEEGKNPLFDTKRNNQLPPMQFDKSKIKTAKGFELIILDALTKIKEGGRIRFKLKVNDLFPDDERKNQDEIKQFMKDSKLTENSKLFMEITLKRVTTSEHLNEERKQKFEEMRKKYEEETEKQSIEEDKLIEQDIQNDLKQNQNIKFEKIYK